MRQLLRRACHAIRHRRLEADLAEEMEFHRAMTQREFEDRGIDETAASLAARRALGNMALAREDARRVWIWPWLEAIFQDAAYVIRTFRRQPVFVLVVLATLTLGIGANTAIFSVVNAVLLKPVPYPDPDGIVSLGYSFRGVWVPGSRPSMLNLLREQTSVFQDVAAVLFDHVNLVGGTEPEQLSAGQANEDFFKLFGAPMAAGRTFTADEDRPGGANVVVLGYGFWQRRFGGNPSVIGSHVSLDDGAHVVIGVLGPRFDSSIFHSESPDVWTPLHIGLNSTDGFPHFMAAARLKPGATIVMANNRAQLAADEFHRRFPGLIDQHDTFSVAPFQRVMVRDVRTPLFVLLGAVACVLLIACANVANLMLVRASVRQREIAIRAAIGASRSRIVRQLLTESLLLSLAGGTLGLALGVLGGRGLLTLNPGEVPRIGQHGQAALADWRVVAFTFVVSLATALVFGLIPAIQAVRPGPRMSLTGNAAHSGTGVPHRKTGSLLVVAEMALALVLFVGAALLIRTFVALGSIDRGFNPRRVLTIRMPLTDPRFATASAIDRLVRDGVQHVSALQGVMAAGAGVSLPLESDWRTSFMIIGRALNGRPPDLADYRVVSPGYLAVFETPLIRGRAFTDRDDGRAPPVAVINEAMARQLWLKEDPLADRIILFPGLTPADDPARQIIGIVGDVRDGLAMTHDPRPTVYVPMAQVASRQLHGDPMAWVVRTLADPNPLSSAIAKALQQTSGGLPVTRVQSMDAVLAESTAGTRFQMVLMAIFGGSALLLAAIGVYGVMAYAVRQRTHEIGVRIALGANPSTVRNMVLGQGVGLALVGVVIGIVSAFALTRVMTGLLFGITAHDPVVFVCAPLLILAVAFVAVWLPARLAVRVNPVVALRAE